MKILLATDGSSCSDAAVEEVARRPWPSDSEIKVLSVAHAFVSEIPDPFFWMSAAHEELLQKERKRAPQRAEHAARRIRARQLSHAASDAQPPGMLEILRRRGFQVDQPRQPGNVHFERYW